MQSHFELSAGLYVNAVIESPKTVSLWLGVRADATEKGTLLFV